MFDYKNNNRLHLIVLMTLISVVRVMQIFAVKAISGDAIIFVAIGKLLHDGDFSLALTTVQHPLYPYLIHLMKYVFSDWFGAAKAVSLFFSILTPFMVYYTVSRITSTWNAFVFALLWIFHPAVSVYSARIATESTYFFFFTGGLLFGYLLIRSNRTIYALLAGLSVGLSYLTRPEGIGLCFIITIFALISVFRKDTYASIMMKKMIVFYVGIFICVTPYIYYISSQAGEFRLSNKKSLAVAMGIKNDDVTVPANLDNKATLPSYAFLGDGYMATLIKMIALFCMKYGVPLILLVLFSLFVTPKYARRPFFESYLFVVIVFYVCVFSLFYVSRRHLAVLMAIALYWVPFGLACITDLCAKYLSVFFKKTERAKLANKLLTYGLSMMLILLFPFAVRPQDADKQVEKEAGLWFKKQHIDSPVIMTNLVRVVLYADGEFLALQNRPNIETYQKLFQTCQKLNVEYLVIEDSTIEYFCPEFLNSVQKQNFERLQSFTTREKYNRGAVSIYKVLY